MITTTLLVLVFATVLQGCARIRENRAEAAYPPTGQLLDIEGTDVHVKVMGDGPDLVMIHGASGSMRDFTFAFAERMSDRYRVILMDRPGLGWTERPGNAYEGAWNARSESPRVQARLLQAAADRLGVTDPIVLGHSYGGAVALAWGLERPDDTAALVLVSAASNPWPGDLGLLYKVNSSPAGGALVIPVITAFVPEPVIRSTLSSIFAPQSAPDGYLDHFGPDMTLRRSAMRANAQQVNSLRPHVVEMSAHYPSLRMPTEIVHGTADTIVPIDIHSEPLARQIPGANLTRLEGIGHMPHHVDPQAVAAAVDRAARRAGL
nr:alpha/beta hydrolase [Sulfitobacter sabulilitoris]